MPSTNRRSRRSTSATSERSFGARRCGLWTCLSHDIISHELGHAILDNVRPLYLYGYDLDGGAFHESFSDLLAMSSNDN